jgi:hypothetical protein
LFDSPEVVSIESSWAFRNGINLWNVSSFAGNGNGFKLGGNATVARNHITQSVAFGNPSKGFDQNNNAGGITAINNTSFKNGINFGFCSAVKSGEKHVFRNNVSVSASQDICNADSKNNTWNTGLAASTADFESIDLSLATAPRNPDGTLPSNKLFRLASGSKLINAGVNAGLPYQGSAPDLGAFERQ